MIDLLKQVPAAYIPLIGTLAGLIGAGATLAGAILVALIKNWHDRKLAKEQREMILRKEVFLTAVESLQNTARYLANFAHMGISNEDRLKSFESTLGAVGKMHLIAGDETLHALIKANNFLLDADTDLWVDRNIVTDLQREMQVLFKNAPQSTQADAAKHKYLKKHLELVEAALSASFNYGNLLINVIISARKELELPFDVDVYRTEMQNTYEMALAKIKRQVKEAREALGNP